MPRAVAVLVASVAISIRPMQVAADALSVHGGSELDFAAGSVLGFQRSAKLVRSEKHRAGLGNYPSLLGLQRSTKLAKIELMEESHFEQKSVASNSRSRQSRELRASTAERGELSSTQASPASQTLLVRETGNSGASLFGLQRSTRLQKVSLLDTSQQFVTPDISDEVGVPVSHASVLGLQRSVRLKKRIFVEEEPRATAVGVSLLDLDRSTADEKTTNGESGGHETWSGAQINPEQSLERVQVSDDLGLQSKAEIVPAPTAESGMRAEHKTASLFGLQRRTKISKGIVVEDERD